jgi:hypothetical protein
MKLTDETEQDPHPDPEPYQNVTDPEHCWIVDMYSTETTGVDTLVSTAKSVVEPEPKLP